MNDFNVIFNVLCGLIITVIQLHVCGCNLFQSRRVCDIELLVGASNIGMVRRNIMEERSLELHCKSYELTSVMSHCFCFILMSRSLVSSRISSRVRKWVSPFWCRVCAFETEKKTDESSRRHKLSPRTYSKMYKDLSSEPLAGRQ